MADYHPLIARAVNGLDKNTGENRRALYERARTALVTQLRGVEPALSEADITRERLALEEAIRKVEAEAAKRPRQEAPVPPPRIESPPAYVPPPPPPPPPPQPQAYSAEQPEPPEDWKDLQRELDELPPTELHEIESPAEDSEPALPPEMESRPPPPPVAPPRTVPWEDPVSPVPAPRNLSGGRAPAGDQGLRGFRDVMAETDDLGGASASAAKAARDRREAFTAMRPSSEMERIEPRAEPRVRPAFTPEDLAPSEADAALPPPRAELRPEPRPMRKRVAPSRMDEDFEEDGRHLRPGRGRAVRAFLVIMLLAVLLGAGFLAYQFRSNIKGLFAARTSTSQQASKTSPQERAKISDRIGGAQQDTSRSNQSGAAVAQRAILYEQGATPQERKQYVGSVIWKTENTAPGPGQTPDIAIKGEVEIPERNLRLDMTIRRNQDPGVPASHTFEVKFNTPPDFGPGGVADMPGIVMEGNQPGSGSPLRGLRVKVTNGYFLIGLLTGDSDVQRNVALMKERAWLFLRMAYTNGQSALLTIEKGVPGDRVFEDALNAWGQNPPAQQRGGL